MKKDRNDDLELLLHNPIVSSGEKMNIINHEDNLKKRSRIERPLFSTATKEDKGVLLGAIQSKYKPQASAILDFILSHKDEITWDPNTNHMKIKGNIVENSNIQDILLTLMNAVTITREADTIRDIWII